MTKTRTEKLTLAAKRAWRTRYVNAGLSLWHATELAGLLEKKTAERRLIQNFLFANHPESAMHLLSLPGSQFELERSVNAERPGTTFTCLERDARFLRVGAKVFSRRAPGGPLHPTDRGSFNNDRVDLINTSAGDLKHHTLRSPITAIWGDFMGLLNARDIAKFIKSLRKKITTDHPVPAVFTFQQGRDSAAFYRGVSGTVGGKRARKIASMFRKAGLEFKVEDYWDYHSDTAGPLRMLNICGMLSHKIVSKGTGRGSGSRRREWTLVTAEEAITLRETISAVPLAAMLGLCEGTVRDWTETYPPDTVTQAELRKIIVACQGFQQR
jgi:hypothetical protein